MNQWEPQRYDPNLHSRRIQGQPQYPPQQPPYGRQQPQSNAFPQQPESRPRAPRQPQPGDYPPYQPSCAPPASQPPRKSRKGLAFLGCGGLGVLVVLIAILAAPSSPSSSSLPAAAQQTQAAAPPARSPAPAVAQTVTYVVTGSTADVTYGPSGSDYSGSVPMHVSKPLGTPLYYSISAQLQGAGTVSCKIEVDGTVVSTSTATGGYNIAQCEISQDPLSGQWTDTNG